MAYLDLYPIRVFYYFPDDYRGGLRAGFYRLREALPPLSASENRIDVSDDYKYKPIPLIVKEAGGVNKFKTLFTWEFYSSGLDVYPLGALERVESDVRRQITELPFSSGVPLICLARAETLPEIREGNWEGSLMTDPGDRLFCIFFDGYEKKQIVQTFTEEFLAELGAPQFLPLRTMPGRTSTVPFNAVMSGKIRSVAPVAGCRTLWHSLAEKNQMAYLDDMELSLVNGLREDFPFRLGIETE